MHGGIGPLQDYIRAMLDSIGELQDDIGTLHAPNSAFLSRQRVLARLKANLACRVPITARGHAEPDRDPASYDGPCTD